MAEPSSTTAAIAGFFGVGFVGALAGVNAAAAVGALCGALIYFAAAQEVPMAKRLMYFVISFIMGYLFSPVLAKARIEWLGIGPIDLPGPAAFIGSALVVTMTLAAIRNKGRNLPSEG
ncbi:MAG: hypothetical protein CMK72_01095 [Pseudomonadaceae bacterium]|jgi:tryptophan-rich sensory protein|uniref:putative holin n=1 Tax=Pseudomonas sp. TaxID=306 RepID=UPI000C1120B5|nr:putative holin [Pseudomonas sp.]MBQ53486.1 hypothetical protein [Pseudomonadaceae bacterium]HCP54580.1 hypothetical protein [Pseudomonas sp.]|tara:strand:- start:886 stop:1239 length:354 start_codon:yes stop_codon:yes gene_type:complete